MQSDGNIAVVGSSMWYNGAEDIVLLRYNNNQLGIEEQQIQKLSVFPNPSTGIFIIPHDAISSDTQYQITDITGKIIKLGFLTGEQTKVDLTDVISGVYFFNALNNTLKLVKK